MFCKKCGNQIKENGCEKCDAFQRSNKNSFFVIIGGLIILLVLHLYISINYSNNPEPFLSLFNFLSFLASIFGSIIGALLIAFLPTCLLCLIIYRTDIKKHGKNCIIWWIIISIVITYLMIKGYNASDYISERGSEDHVSSETEKYYEDEFYINFPGSVELANADTEKLHLNTYASSDGSANYYVKIGRFNNEMIESWKSKPETNEYFLDIVTNDIALYSGSGGEVISSDRMVFFKKYDGVSYKNLFNSNENKFFSKGIFFIKDDGTTVQVSVNYPEYLDGEMNKKYENFINSLILKK
jgi:uncharacterized integral membrane protein